ncbi:MAG TPA: magnesium-translocating P-type ATPase, partial [Candidatus Dormibacteraeota bacterium]|nr:magnesium-translocating P-type ATPase [Candidatus Dormibacteraeota bacterium]
MATIPAVPAGSATTGPPGLVEAARLSGAAVLERLQSSPRGLSGEEAQRRLGHYGPNAIRSHGVLPLAILGRQLRNPLLILLGAATLTSLLVGERTGALIILGIVALSVGLGFFNEYRSERVVDALHSSIRHLTLALRDGRPLAIDVTEVAPGDVVLLRTGDLVPADLRLLEARELECDEAVLTGEAMPKTKRADPEAGADLVELGLRSVAYMGTTVRGGSGSGLVLQTGSRTVFGKIALRLGERQPETTFQRGLRSFSILLVRVTAVLAGGIFIANALLGRSILESALFSLAIAVGLTPQLLPAIVTVSLASGARNLARHRVVVKRLISIEDLGNIEILFTDKTGTLTEGRITYAESLDPAGGPSEEAFRMGLLCAAGASTDLASSGNALDAALLEAGIAPPGYRALDQLPFDHQRRLMSALVEAPGGEKLLITKGAPESLLERCRSVPAAAQATLDKQFAAGARVIAVGSRPWSGGPRCSQADERDLDLAGFLTFIDAPKADAAASLEQLKKLGVEVKLVTGDNPLVAETVCRSLGLEFGESITGQELDALSDAELIERLPRTGIFARVSPEQKSRIIQAQRSLHKDVGFLGDGVNDAVALRDADVGISVDTGSEVAKDAADIVLLGKDLGILARGVLEGRRIFANTMKYVLMGTSSNFGNMFSAAGGSLLLNFLPMTPTQILLNNLLYDGGEMTIPSDNVDTELLERPAQWDIRLIRRFMIFFGPISSIFDFATFGVMLWVFHAHGSLFQTAWFTESLCTQSLVIFAIRTRRVPFFRSRPGAALTLGTLATVLVGLLLPYTPLAGLFGLTALPPAFLAILVLMVVVYLALVEIGKSFFFVIPSPRPALPIGTWEHPPALERIERLASRWTVRPPRR